MPGGDAQTMHTLRQMKAVANRSLFDPIVIGAGVDAVRGYDGHSPPALARALRSWLSVRVDFQADPLIDGDFLRAPRYMVDEIRAHGSARGDCDDCATLAATLGKSIGLAARFVAVSFFDSREPFAHVYCEVMTPGGAIPWLDMDVTESEEKRRAIPVARRLELPV